MKTMKKVVAVAFALALTAVQTASAKTVEIASGGDIAAAITEATSDDTPAEVVLGVGDYAPKATISISSPVTVRGMTGNPADVRVSGGTHKAFSLDNASAVLRDLVLRTARLMPSTKMALPSMSSKASSPTVSFAIARCGK